MIDCIGCGRLFHDYEEDEYEAHDCNESDENDKINWMMVVTWTLIVSTCLYFWGHVLWWVF